MVDATVGVRIRSEGADELKTRLRELRTEFERGDISVSEYSKGLRGVNRDARSMTQQSQVATRVFLAQHPAINSLSRAMSTFGSISRTALSITTAFSVAKLAFGGSTSAMMELQSELAEAERNFNKLNEAGDKIGATEQKENIDILKQKIKELTDSASEEKIVNLVNLGSTVSLMGGSITSIIKNKDAFSGVFKGIAHALGSKTDAATPMGAIRSFNTGIGTSTANMGKMVKYVPTFTGALTNISTFAGTAAGGVEALNTAMGASTLAAGGLVAAATPLATILSSVAGTLGPIIAAWGSIRPLIEQFAGQAFPQPQYAEAAPMPTTPAGGGKSNGAGAGDKPFTYKGLTGQAAINAKKAGFADGGIIKEPTMLFGMRSGGMGIMAEKGPEAIMPLKSGSGGSSGGNTTIIVQGSVIRESELWGIVNKYGLRDLKRSGF